MVFYFCKLFWAFWDNQKKKWDEIGMDIDQNSLMAMAADLWAGDKTTFFFIAKYSNLTFPKYQQDGIVLEK